jgi:hypothetical protein
MYEILWLIYGEVQVLMESKCMLPETVPSARQHHPSIIVGWMTALLLSSTLLPSAYGWSEQQRSAANEYYYPNFADNPYLTKRMQRCIRPYLLPSDHPARAAMDQIFAKPGVIRNTKTVKAAGFTIFHSQKKSFIRVLKHPLLNGYLLKVYLDTERNVPKGSPGWKRLTMRCIVAEKIKSIIAKHKIQNFIVADKWVYPLPQKKGKRRTIQPVVLLVKDMQIYGTRGAKQAWKKAGYRTARELFTIFHRGYGSAFLAGNLPYTRSGKFAFIDTEFGKRDIPMIHLQRYFSSKVRGYWQKLLYRSKGCGSQYFEPLETRSSVHRN